MAGQNASTDKMHLPAFIPRYPLYSLKSAYQAESKLLCDYNKARSRAMPFAPPFQKLSLSFIVTINFDYPSAFLP